MCGQYKATDSSIHPFWYNDYFFVLKQVGTTKAFKYY